MHKGISLYIPIWFYSNQFGSESNPMLFIFTFQSGSIQIEVRKQKGKDDTTFTFQSGSIQIKIALRPYQEEAFTFQSGSIQILSRSGLYHTGKPLHSNLVLFKCFFISFFLQTLFRFTFQSGSIQMFASQRRRHARWQLYIPIWFYSNKLTVLVFLVAVNFTFQSGSIQMVKREIQVCLVQCFTFQSGSIQIGDNTDAKSPVISLHSNLVLFKCRSRRCAGTTGIPLHSNLVLFKFCPGADFIIQVSLYIPIWFYSNEASTIFIFLKSSFTFQSGSIQMTIAFNLLDGILNFTFQSGSIQISRTT